MDQEECLPVQRPVFVSRCQTSAAITRGSVQAGDELYDTTAVPGKTAAHWLHASTTPTRISQ
jgi:hypothetical protein